MTTILFIIGIGITIISALDIVKEKMHTETLDERMEKLHIEHEIRACK